MPSLRTAKTHFYRADGSGAGSYAFDTLCPLSLFYTTAVISNGQANTVINDVWVCPQNLVIAKLVLIVNTGGFSQATDAWNIVKGTGAETGSAGTGQTVQAAGNSVFAVDKALTGLVVSTDYQVFQAIPDVPEAYYAAGDVLSLRYVTGATAGAHTRTTAGYDIQVFGLLAPYDPKQYGRKDADPSVSF